MVKVFLCPQRLLSGARPSGTSAVGQDSAVSVIHSLASGGFLQCADVLPDFAILRMRIFRSVLATGNLGEIAMPADPPPSDGRSRQAFAASAV